MITRSFRQIDRMREGENVSTWFINKKKYKNINSIKFIKIKRWPIYQIKKEDNYLTPGNYPKILIFFLFLDLLLKKYFLVLFYDLKSNNFYL